MKGVNLSLNISSITGILVFLGAVSWVGGKGVAIAFPAAGAEISSAGFLLFLLGIVPWGIFVALSIIRNIDAL